MWRAGGVFPYIWQGASRCEWACLSVILCPSALRRVLAQYTDGDEDLIKKLPSVMPDHTPTSPEQITKLRLIRQESTGKLV